MCSPLHSKLPRTTYTCAHHQSKHLHIAHSTTNLSRVNLHIALTYYQSIKSKLTHCAHLLPIYQEPLTPALTYYQSTKNHLHLCSPPIYQEPLTPVLTTLFKATKNTYHCAHLLPIKALTHCSLPIYQE
jgi:hypothetical protein